jgi:NAD(P)-dependent dehydrogenase (short-subunit alcohol dehydrogenase family)
MKEPVGEAGGAAESALTDSTVLIVGSPSPLLSAIARATRVRGGRVALAATPSPDAAAAGDIACFPFVPGAESTVDALFDGLTAPFDRLDVMIAAVPNARLEALHESSLEGWRAAVTRPLRQLFWLVRRAVEECLATGGGMRIVLLLEPASGQLRNDMVEEALRSFARSMAREYGRREITCTVVQPTLDSTERSADEQAYDAIVEHVLFLASPAASFVNGDVWRVALDTTTDVGNDSSFTAV